MDDPTVVALFKSGERMVAADRRHSKRLASDEQTHRELIVWVGNQNLNIMPI